MQLYAKAAKDLLDNVSSNVAKLSILKPLSEHNGAGNQQQAQLQTAPTLPLEARVARFKQELLASKINVQELKRLAFQGVPDKDGLRAITWKLLLGYLPPDASEWDEQLARKRTQYLLFCEDLIIDPKKLKEAKQQAAQAAAIASTSAATSTASNGSMGHEESSEAHDHHTSQSPAQLALDPLSAALAKERLSAESVTEDDHPLSLRSTSKWHEFFKDNEVMEQIDRDVMRTHPDMHFFSGDGRDAELHRKEMKRALFVFAKLNPGIRYIQGMNELYAPLYWAFKTDNDATAARYAEADAFFCFVDMMSEVRDHFCQTLDNSSSGIKATIARLMALLQHTDPELVEHLGRMKIDPQFFAFRWITLLLTQEFPFPDSVRIWDTLFSDAQGRLDCLLRVCLAMLQHVRAQLLSGDFATNVKTLQRFPSVDVNVILRSAAQLPPCSVLLGAPL